jgi:hypothetical protein
VNNCEEMTGKIWAGERSAELDEHVRSCPNCRAELQEKEQLITQLASLDMPMPTRSLKPSPEVIRATVRRNKRKNWRRFASVAAAAVVVLVGTATGLTLHDDPSKQPSDSNDPPTQVIADPKPPQNNDTPPPTTPQVTPEPLKGQGIVVVDQMAENQDIAQAIAEYVKPRANPKEVKQIRITAFQTSGAIFSNTERVGDVTLDVKLQQGASSPYFVEGKQTVLAKVVRDTRERPWDLQFFEPMTAYMRTANEAAEMWLNTLQSRNGAIQYGVSSPALRESMRTALVQNNWFVRTSDPSIKSFQILPTDGKWNGLPFVRARLTLEDDQPPLDVDIALKQYGSVWRVEQYEYSKQPGSPAGTDPASDAKNSVNLAFIKKNLSIGEPRAAIEKIYGTDYVVEKNSNDGNDALHYIYYGKPGYQYKKPAGGEGLLTYDEQGLKSGDVRLELQVGLTDKGTVKDFTVYYHVDPEQYGRYRVTADGESKDNGVQR